MCAAVGVVKHRASEVEIVAVRVAGVDSEPPIARFIIERTVEIIGCTVGTILPIVEDIAQVGVPSAPIYAVKVVVSVDAHEVVEIDFVSSLILIVGQIEFVSHLVGKEKGLLACLFVAHRTDSKCESEERH